MSASDGSETRTCACGCGATFTPTSAFTLYASPSCKRTVEWRRRTRKPSSPVTRATTLARGRALSGTCPACGSKLGNDANLVYCRARCGYLELARRPA